MNIVKLLNKVDLDVLEINEACPPCTILQEGKPIGFIQEDLTPTMLPNKENEEKLVEKIIAFGRENFGRDEILENEYQLSEYEGYILTSSFDFEDQVPMYNVFRKTEEGLQIVDSSTDKTTAATSFVEKSALLNANAIEKRERVEHTVEQPSFYEILRNTVHQLGMKLKLYFTKNQSYVNVEDHNQTVATINDKLDISYNKKVDLGLKEKLQTIVEETEDLKAQKTVYKVRPKRVYGTPLKEQSILIDPKKEFADTLEI